MEWPWHQAGTALMQWPWHQAAAWQRYRCTSVAAPVAPDSNWQAQELHLLQENGLQRSVQRLTHILKQNSPPKPHTVLQSPQQVFVHRLDDIQAPLPLQVADPAVRLALGIDHQRPPASLGDNDTCVKANCSWSSSACHDALGLPYIGTAAQKVHAS